MNRLVQSSVFPCLEPCTEKRLYFRYNSLIDISLTDGKVFLFKGGRLLTNTYFNSVSVGKVKKYASLTHLAFKICFSGQLRVVWKLKALQHSDKILQENFLESQSLSEVLIELPFWSHLETGMLFFELHAVANSQLLSFQYITKQDPLRTVHLGIVITHFNRQAVLLPALERLKNALASPAFEGAHVELCVVDNSRNLPPIEGVTLIKNPNLGGAGGFSRGLLHCREKGLTHCLFMDDDASCEMESIRRTLFYLSYTSNEVLAISGAMLREVQPNMQHENGGVFNGLCHSVKCHYNLLSTRALLANEQEERIDYGAWWFFAFPVRRAKYLAFPYFVRGDDISFSLANRFDIVTMNGIASWQADFAHKAAPLQLYLDQRNHVMHFLHGLVAEPGYRKFLKTSCILFILNALSYQYESARACTLALEDVLKGPEFWRQNVDMQEKRKQLLALTKRERIVEVPFDLKAVAAKGNPIERRWRRWLRVLSLNGHLIPNIFFRRAPVWQYKHYGVRLREIFLHREAIYFTDEESRFGVVLQHSKRLFFQYAWWHFLMVAKLCWNAKKWKKIYQETYPELTSESFWRQQFKQVDN